MKTSIPQGFGLPSVAPRYEPACTARILCPPSEHRFGLFRRLQRQHTTDQPTHQGKGQEAPQ